MARQAPALSFALHADCQLVAEPRRAVVRHADRQGHSARSLPLSTRAHQRNRDIPAGQQREPRAVRLDRHRRADSHQRAARARHPQPTSKSKLRHYTSCLAEGVLCYPGTVAGDDLMNYAAQRLAEATAKRNAVLGSLGAHLAVDPGETVEQRAVLGAEALHESQPTMRGIEDVAINVLGEVY